MLPRILHRFLGRQRSNKGAKPGPLAQRLTDPRAWRAGMPKGKVLCIFQGEQLVERLDRIPERTPGADETWWMIPQGDITLAVGVGLDDYFAETPVALQFEPEWELANFLAGRESLTRREVLDLVTSQLCSVLDALGHTTPDTLRGIKDAERERLRAHLSLLLQAHGLRCAGVGAFTFEKFAEVVDETDEPAQAAVAEEAAAPSTEPAAVEPSEEDVPTLETVLAEVDSPGRWEELIAELEESGLPVDEEVAEQLAELGQQVVQHQTPPRKAAATLERLAAAARTRAHIPRPDLRRWRGLNLRLALYGPSTAPGKDTGARTAGAQAAPVKEAVRWPGDSRLAGGQSTDQRLRAFLEHTIRMERASLDEYRGRQNSTAALIALRDLDQKMDLIQQLLRTVPALTPRQSKLRPERERFHQLLHEVDQAVTAAELAHAQNHLLQRETPGSAAWQTAVVGMGAALDQLDKHLSARRAVR